LKKVASAIETSNTNAFLELIAPDELKIPVTGEPFEGKKATGATIEDYARSNISMFSKQMKNPFVITREVSCGEITLVFYKTENAAKPARGWWIATRRSGDGWYLTSLPSNRLRSTTSYPVLQFLGLPITAYPNLFLDGNGAGK